VPVWKWIVAWVGAFAGFLTLSFYPAQGNVQSLIPRILFTGIPLVVFAILTRPYWKSIFRKPRGRDYGYMVLFAALNLVLTPILALLVTMFGFPTKGNEAIATVGQGGVLDTVAFYVGSGIQLVGEELIVIIPFLAIMSILHLNLGVSRKSAIIWAWVISAIWFGALHLPTYGWNIVQAIVIIGGARIALTLAFIRTKNIWVSTGAHILNDWTLFTGAMVLAALKATAG